ncbi:MAG: DUF4097 family beta strand repeat-containing protein [Phycisphaerales bacterium]
MHRRITPKSRLIPITIVAAWLAMIPFALGCACSSCMDSSGSAMTGSNPKPERRTITTELPWAGAAPLRVDARNGAIELTRAAPGTTITRIQAEARSTNRARLDAAELLAITEPDGTLAISLRWPDGEPATAEGVSIAVQVPDASSLTLTAGNGTITTAGFACDATLRTSNGHITAHDHHGRIDARTGNGRIEVARSQGHLELNTSNAQITIDDHTGPINARTGNARITVTNSDGPVELHTSNAEVKVTDATGPVIVSSGNGTVTVRLTDDNPGPVRIATSNAHIRLAIGDAFAGILTAAASNGTISTSLRGLTVEQLTNDDRARRYRIGPTTAPTHESTLAVGNGSITVTRR